MVLCGVSIYTVKKVTYFSVPNRDVTNQNLASDFPAGDGKISNPFFTVYPPLRPVIACKRSSRIISLCVQFGTSFSLDLNDVDDYYTYCTELCKLHIRECFYRV
jgi:hypothetical protein